MRFTILCLVGLGLSCAKNADEVLSSAPTNTGGVSNGGSGGSIGVDAGGVGGSSTGGSATGGAAGGPPVVDAGVDAPKTCFAPLTLCDDECKDLTSDPDNCGECGLDCGEGPCTESQCVPYAVAVSPVASAWNAVSLAVDDKNLYLGVVSQKKVIYRGSKQGPFTQTLAELAPDEPGAPGYITPRAGSVYWITSGPHGFVELPSVTSAAGTVRRANTDGTDLQTLHTGGELHGLAVTDQYVYFSDRGTHSSGYADGTIRRMAHDGTGLVTLVSGQRDPMHVTVDGSHIYWMKYGSASQGHTDGAVMRANLDGTEPTSLTSGQFKSRAMHVDATHVYWVSHDPWSNGIWRKPKSSSPAIGDSERVTDDNDTVSEGFSANSTGVFWTFLFADWVLGHAKTGGTTQTIGESQSQARLTTVDENSLYWVTNTTITKTALPSSL
jgi:hypothetical protein